MRPSMGSIGDCFDNAMAESFFATLECELLDRSTFRSRAEAERAIFEFIEDWYNPHRRHSSLAICRQSTSSSSIPSTRAGLRPQMLNCPLKRGNSTPEHKEAVLKKMLLPHNHSTRKLA